MNKIKGNKLIVEFRNCISTQNRRDDTVYKNTPVSPHAHYELKFHSSWDWLMSVVEYIDEILDEEDFVTISYNRCFIEINNPFWLFFDKDIDSLTIEGTGNSKIKATWNAVCEFITWYNENKNS